MTEREIISEIRKYVKKNADNPIYRCDNGWINLSGINSRIYAEIIVLSKKLIETGQQYSSIREYFREANEDDDWEDDESY